VRWISGRCAICYNMGMEASTSEELRDDLKVLAGKLRHQIAASEKMAHDSKLHLAEVEKHFARLAKKPKP
jgi:hypothetical protein